MINIGLLIIRLVIGLLFVGHGAQKLLGWFGGYGLKGSWLESKREELQETLPQVEVRVLEGDK